MVCFICKAVVHEGEHCIAESLAQFRKTCFMRMYHNAMIVLKGLKIMRNIKDFFKTLNKMQISLYVILMAVDIYILGNIDFVEHKLYGVLFVVLNSCLITFIKYGGKK